MGKCIVNLVKLTQESIENSHTENEIKLIKLVTE